MSGAFPFIAIGLAILNCVLISVTMVIIGLTYNGDQNEKKKNRDHILASYKFEFYK